MLKRILDNLEGVDESLHKYYAKGQDGTFLLQAESEDVTPLKNTIQALRREKSDLESKVGDFETQVGKLNKDLEKLKSGDKKPDPDAVRAEVERITSQLTEKHTQELLTRDERITSLTGTINNTLLERSALEAINSQKGIAKVLLPHVKEQLKVVESDGKFDVRVINAKGEEVLSKKTNSTEPMTVAELVESMKADELFGRCFEGSGSSGSGSPKTGGTPNNTPWSSKDQVESEFPGGKIAFMKEHPGLYSQLPRTK